ncbi:hypothetical protein [Sphingomonas sp.]|uniref:hypothetical protein n=1 Tax=Sphingomonas sp. TaxID=28214 RepID=UPI003B000F66
MLIAFALLAAATPTLRTDIAVTGCTADCAVPRRSRYRLDPQISSDADTKTRALAETGRPCATAARLCTRRPRTLLTTSLDD